MRNRAMLLGSGYVLLAILSGCHRGSNADHASEQPSIQMEGSDTMVPMAEAWAQGFGQGHPSINVRVFGGGTSVGIASLVDGNCDMATASRPMKDVEIRRVEANRGASPKQIVVAYDALTIYVHKDNPLDTVSIEELAEIYGENGKITKWTQLGVTSGTLADADISCVTRRRNSGTYDYFREAVLGKDREYKPGSIEQSGARDVVAMVSRTPGAIGYSGMGFRTSGVKILRLSRKKGEPGMVPNIENASNDSYPLTRPLYIDVAGEPSVAIRKYLDWILGLDGQTIVADFGFVPVGRHK
jgi:phosphate transport system substrate-binding protein